MDFVTPIQAPVLRRLVIWLLLSLFIVFESCCANADDGQCKLEALAENVNRIVEKRGSSCVALLDSSTGKWFSGVIISKDGLLLTVAHGISEASVKITVFLEDGTEVFASLAVWDRAIDLALLRFDSFAPPERMVAPLATDLQAYGGQAYVAVGHPFGFSVSRGTSSRLGFLACHSIITGDFLTTAPLSPGDSGGGLFDFEGRIVAIHRAADRSGGYSSHIPIRSAIQLLARTEPNPSESRK